MARFKFRRGEAVVHYSLVGPHIGYWGRKAGAYRVLATNPDMLDAGACISEKDQGHTIFPAPNSHGVYDTRHALRIGYRSSSGRDHAAAFVLQIAPDVWAWTTEYTIATGGYSGFQSPLTAHDSCDTEDKAITAAIAQLAKSLVDLAKRADGAGSAADRRRLAVRKALVTLLSQVSPDLRDTIFMLLNAK